MEMLENLKSAEINYKILNPGGNKTALVIGNEYDQNERNQINDEILKKNLDVEQVGFIDTNENMLQMAGGEFCINATRCAIWHYLEGSQGEIELKVSGCKGKIKGGIRQTKEVYADMQIEKKLDNLIHKERYL